MLRRYENARVLIVDDSRANLLALEAVIEPLGCVVVQASSGAQAIERALQQEFAVVLLDIVMPEMDGFETAALIKSRATHDPPIVFLTARQLEADSVLQGYGAGGVDLLTKPFDPVIIRSKVAIFCELYVNTQQLRRQAELLRGREQMLAMVSHDLRTPLNAISATVNLLDAQASLRDMADLKTHFGRIQRSVEQMGRLVNDLLDLSRMEADKLVLEAKRHDVAALVCEAIELIRPVATAKRQTIYCVRPETAWATCDEGRLLQVISNLLANATKFTPELGKIHVTVGREKNVLRISVTDTGPGISDDEARFIFEPFWQGKPHARHGGAGLGLWIARRIVEAHRGTLWAESMPGMGARFCLTLPCLEVPDVRVSTDELPTIDSR